MAGCWNRRLFSAETPVRKRTSFLRRMSRSRVRVFYAGRVQGVGFRYTVKTLVTGFEVTGIIRNLSDGRVELIAEGVKEELEAFQQAVHDSGLGHLIDDEQASWSEARGDFCGFEIIS